MNWWNCSFFLKENIEAFPLHQYGENYSLVWVIQLLWNGAFFSQHTEINVLPTCLIHRKQSIEKRLGDLRDRIALRWFKEKLQTKISRALSTSSYRPGQPGWVGFRDLASSLFSFQKFWCVHMRRRGLSKISVFATEISVTELGIFPIWTLQPRYRLICSLP